MKESRIRDKPQTMMAQVLAYIERGINDRDRIAEELGVDRGRVISAISNLNNFGYIEKKEHKSNGYRLGRGYTIYQPTGLVITPERGPGPRKKKNNLFAGVSSIFNVGVNT